MFDIISIGDSTIDTFLFVKDLDIREEQGDKKAVMSWGDKLPVEKLIRTVAGNAANNAVASSRLGLKTAFYTVLAHDTGGREILHKMQKERVSLRYVVTDDNHGTNASTVLTQDGERTIFVYHEHRKYKLPNLLPASWVYLTSMANGFKVINKDLCKYLDKYKVCLGFNPGTFQLRAGVKANKEILQRTNLLSVNVEEAKMWVGDFDDPEILCNKLMELGPRAVALTDGRSGAYSKSEEGFYYIQEFPGERLEATGAGDSFTSAYIAALAHNLPHSEALRWGPVNAASVVSKIGPQEGLLDRKELEKRLLKNKKYQPILISDKKIKNQVLKIVEEKKEKI